MAITSSFPGLADNATVPKTRISEAINRVCALNESADTIADRLNQLMQRLLGTDLSETSDCSKLTEARPSELDDLRLGLDNLTHNLNRIVTAVESLEQI